MNGKEEPSSSMFRVDLLTGDVTLPVASTSSTPMLMPRPLLAPTETGQMLPPLTSDVPCNSMGYTGQAEAPGKAKVKKVKEKNSEEYVIRRQRNNVAVKKSREKIRERSAYTLQKVEQLKVENEQLESKIAILTKELGVLKDLFMDHARGFCAGGDANMLTPGQLESLLGCKVIQGSGDGAGPSSSTARASSSTIEPLINAAEIELIAFSGQNATTVTSDEPCDESVKQVIIIDSDADDVGSSEAKYS